MTAFRVGREQWRARLRAGSGLVNSLPSKGGYADIGITSFMPIGWLCRVGVVGWSFPLL
jgi:hypothetical protein